MNEFSTFRLSIDTEGAYAVEDVTSRYIEKVNMRLAPGPTFKKALTDKRFEQV